MSIIAAEGRPTVHRTPGGKEPVDRRLRAIRARWEGSSDERAATRAAVRRQAPELANTPADVEARRRRVERRNITFEGIVNGDDSLWTTFFTCGSKAAKAVGRIVETPPRQPLRPVGTGSLVSPCLLLTNNHVCPDAETSAGMSVQFRYEFDDVGRERSPDQRVLDPGRFFFTDEDLDFSLVAVAPKGGKEAGDTYGSIPLIEQGGKAICSERLNVIHHPAGDRKRVSLRENRMVAEDDLWIRYETDTRAGSSGAPVFNDQWEMVALHHGGVPKLDAEGNELAVSGERWIPSMGEDALAYVGNEGARVSRILRSLKAADLDAAAAELIHPVLIGGL